MATVMKFVRGSKWSIVLAVPLLAWDVLFTGSLLMSLFFCPIWFVLSLLKNAIQRPGWGLTLVRIGIPALTLILDRVNNDVQLGIAEANAQRVVAAVEQYHAANGTFPKTLVELVPQYLDRVLTAKYTMGPFGKFRYTHNGEGDNPVLVWMVVPPYLRKVYNFERRDWRYVD